MRRTRLRTILSLLGVCLYVHFVMTLTYSMFAKLGRSNAVNWKELLNFAPDIYNPNCILLFSRFSSQRTASTLTMFKDYQKHMQLLKEKSKININDLQETKDDFQKRTVLIYQAIARTAWLETICLVGFSKGETALAWLTAKPNTRLYAFDIKLHNGTSRIARELRKLFKGRFTLMLSRRKSSMTQWLKPGRCHALVVDGGHALAQCVKDLLSMKKLVSQRHIMIMENMKFHKVNRTWNLLVDMGMMSERFRCTSKYSSIDFAIGQYGQFYGETVS